MLRGGVLGWCRPLRAMWGIFGLKNLLKEFQDVFAWDYKYLKGLVQEMGEMKIDIKPEARPINK